jgi:hypothetical protein
MLAVAVRDMVPRFAELVEISILDGRMGAGSRVVGCGSSIISPFRQSATKWKKLRTPRSGGLGEVLMKDASAEQELSLRMWFVM